LLILCAGAQKAMDVQVTRAHSFPWKILPNSAGQFAKFRGWPQQNRPNSAARHGLPFMILCSSETSVI